MNEESSSLEKETNVSCTSRPLPTALIRSLQTIAGRFAKGYHEIHASTLVSHIRMSEDYNEETNFLGAFVIENEGTTPSFQQVAQGTTKNSNEEDNMVYQSKKPKWWVQLSGRASKGQRRAIREMESHQLSRPPYGEFIDWNKAFSVGNDDDDRTNDIWLEIGFGGGENLLRLAEQYRDSSHPRLLFVGAEIHPGGVGKCMKRMQEAIQGERFFSDYTLYSKAIDPFNSSKSLDDCRYCHKVPQTRAEFPGQPSANHPYSNLRIYRGDGVKLLPYVLASTLSTILITNPDPFPNDHEVELRMMQVNTVRGFRRVLREGGRLFLATDDTGFFEWSQCVLEHVNARDQVFRPVIPCPDRTTWLPVVSHYEQRGWNQGRQNHLACWEAV